MRYLPSSIRLSVYARGLYLGRGVAGFGHFGQGAAFSKRLMQNSRKTLKKKLYFGPCGQNVQTRRHTFLPTFAYLSTYPFRGLVLPRLNSVGPCLAKPTELAVCGVSRQICTRSDELRPCITLTASGGKDSYLIHPIASVLD